MEMKMSRTKNPKLVDVENPIHWTQTPEGREKMRKIAKRRQRKLRKAQSLSSGEQAVAVASGKAPELGRQQFYEETVRQALAHDELPKLMAEIREQSLAHLWEMLR
jgi:BRCT domain type II-containing protein